MTKRKTGTREWSEHSVNCVRGCSHNCRYCYARTRATRFHQLPEGGWQNETANEKAIRNYPKYDGTVMFPTTHDITPVTVSHCYRVLSRLLGAGNHVLIVSKPHLECIKSLCLALEQWKGNVLFRFTIGSRRDDILEFWEPGAPRFVERYESLKYATGCGYATSVSMEPMLEPQDAVGQRVSIDSARTEQMVTELEFAQRDEAIWGIYNALKNDTKARWKDSIKEVVGL